jgi:hypothetical protein
VVRICPSSIASRTLLPSCSCSHSVAGACPGQNNWCHVLGPAVPSGNGFVYDGFGLPILNC